MSAMASQITGVSIVYSTGCSDADQRKHQSPAPLVFVRGIHWWPVNSPHKGSIMPKMFPFDDVIMNSFICPYHSIPEHDSYFSATFLTEVKAVRSEVWQIRATVLLKATSTWYVFMFNCSYSFILHFNKFGFPGKFCILNTFLQNRDKYQGSKIQCYMMMSSNENILRFTGPLSGGTTGHRWIPRTKGQWRGKCFHLMTSSCQRYNHILRGCSIGTEAIICQLNNRGLFY